MARCLLTLLIFSGLCQGINAQPGDFDIHFGTNGILITPMGNANDFINSTAVQPDGKILAAGYLFNGTDHDAAIVKYLPDGDLDSSFDGDGKLVFGQTLVNEVVQFVTLQTDKRILAGGYLSVNNLNKFFIFRLKPDGAFDSTFDHDGRLIVPVGLKNDILFSLAIQQDGRILAAGSSENAKGSDFVILRFLTDGTPDSSFDIDGKQITSFKDGNSDAANAMLIQPDGKILVAGFAGAFPEGTFGLARYETDGRLDTSFGQKGLVTTDFGSNDNFAQSVLIQPDGKIVASGGAYNGNNYDFALARYNQAGVLDPGFGVDGKIVENLGPGLNAITSSALEPGGNIIVGGYSQHVKGLRFALLRYLPDGSPDSSFGVGGRVFTSILKDDGLRTLSLQNDGKIVAAGYSSNAVNYDFGLIRYLGGNKLGVLGFPKKPALIHLFPNPLGPNSHIEYSLSSEETISIRIWDEQGKLINTVLESEKQSRGDHSIPLLIPKTLKPGVYFVVISNGSGQFVVRGLH